MLRLTMAAVLLLPFLDAPAQAQDRGRRSSFSLAPGVVPKLDKRSFSFPIVDYGDAAASPQQRNGIIAGQEIAPGTLVGVGLFETAPRIRGYVPEMNPNAPPKRSRQAAVGLSWRF